MIQDNQQFPEEGITQVAPMNQEPFVEEEEEVIEDQVSVEEDLPEFIHTGFAKKKPHNPVVRKWQDRLLRLSKDELWVSSLKDSSKANRIRLDNVKAEIVTKKFQSRGFVFHISFITKEKEYHFACETRIEQEDWVDAIMYRKEKIIKRPSGCPISLSNLKALSEAGMGIAPSQGRLSLHCDPEKMFVTIDDPENIPDVSGKWNEIYQTAFANAYAVLEPPPLPPKEGVSEAEADAKKKVDAMHEVSGELSQEFINGLYMQRVVGKFLVFCQDAVEKICGEMLLPEDDRELRPMPASQIFDLITRAKKPKGTINEAAENEEKMWLFNDVLFRLVQEPPSANAAADADGEEALLADEVAMAVAGHELKGIQAYLDSGIGNVGLHTTLTAVLDYKGFRMVATAVAGIAGDATLIYGQKQNHSAPEGVAVSTEGSWKRNPEVETKIQQAGQGINLATHVVFNDEERIAIHTSIEVQAHACADQRVYLINLPRVFPADMPKARTPEYLTKLLRPEFVKSYSKPLSSDAYCNVGGRAPDSEQNDKEVIKASLELQEATIPEFVSRLDLLDLWVTDSQSCVDVFHNAGINMRYIGRVAEMTQLPYLRSTLELEMAARVCKRVLWRNMRRQSQNLVQGFYQPEPQFDEFGQYVFEDPFNMSHEERIAYYDKQVRLWVVDFFNLVLGQGKESEEYWTSVLEKEVSQKFGYTAKRGNVHMGGLFLALQHHCGIVFSDEYKYDFKNVDNPLGVENIITFRVLAACPRNNSVASSKIAARSFRNRSDDLVDQTLAALNMRLAVHKSMRGVANMDGARLLTDLALFHCLRKDYGNAQAYAEAALGMAKRIQVDSIRIYRVLLECYYVENLHDKALECFKHCISIANFAFGLQHPLLLDVYCAMGRMYYDDKKYSQCLTHYDDALTLSRHVLGDNHPATAYYATKLGHAYRALQLFEKAILVYDKAVITYETMLGPNSPKVAYACFYKAEAMMDAGNNDGAIHYATRAFKIREKELGPDDPVTLNSVYQIACIAEKGDQITLALDHFQDLLDRLKAIDGEVDNSILEYIQNITKAMIHLLFRHLSSGNQAVLDRIRSQNRHWNDPELLSDVITQLYSSRPADYVMNLFDKVAVLNDDAYVELACISQLVEDQEIELTRHAVKDEMDQLPPEGIEGFGDIGIDQQTLMQSPYMASMGVLPGMDPYGQLNQMGGGYMGQGMAPEPEKKSKWKSLFSRKKKEEEAIDPATGMTSSQMAAQQMGFGGLSPMQQQQMRMNMGMGMDPRLSQANLAMAGSPSMGQLVQNQMMAQQMQAGSRRPTFTHQLPGRRPTFTQQMPPPPAPGSFGGPGAGGMTGPFGFTQPQTVSGGWVTVQKKKKSGVFGLFSKKK